MAQMMASPRRRIRAVVALAGVMAIGAVLWARPFEWFRTPPRPLPEVLHSFGLKIPEGAHEVSYKDFGAYQGDEAMFRFTVTKQQLTQFTSTLRSGSDGPVKLEEKGIRYIDTDDVKRAGWHLDQLSKYSSAYAYAGESGNYYSGQVSVLVDEREGPSRLVVYLWALKSS
ncbi:hypothetical protein [Streptomyces sp. BK340]|uniref:hypothetical protein n=1 Tax=Streptomyces sp. BK340 TaxID=2572903 RepID=UPI0011A8DE67|nr:hypothetical protein [Streptomyces sp. BK340]